MLEKPDLRSWVLRLDYHVMSLLSLLICPDIFPCTAPQPRKLSSPVLWANHAKVNLWGKFDGRMKKASRLHPTEICVGVPLMSNFHFCWDVKKLLNVWFTVEITVYNFKHLRLRQSVVPVHSRQAGNLKQRLKSGGRMPRKNTIGKR